MIQSILDYLGWSKESKQIRRKFLENLKKANEKLDCISDQLRESSQKSRRSVTQIRQTAEVYEKRRIGT